MSNPTAAMDFILSERLQNTRLNGVGWCVYVLVGGWVHGQVGLGWGVPSGKHGGVAWHGRPSRPGYYMFSLWLHLGVVSRCGSTSSMPLLP